MADEMSGRMTRMTNVLWKTKCRYCEKFTMQNIKRHNKSCEAKSKEPVKVKMDFNGHGKAILKEVMVEIGYEQLAIFEETGMSYFRHMHVYLNTKNHWTYENLRREIKQELCNWQAKNITLMNLEGCQS